ncbi:hypothetical protein ACPA9J_00425 [Pseudomonas aeruginosa]
MLAGPGETAGGRQAAEPGQYHSQPRRPLVRPGRPPVDRADMSGSQLSGGPFSSNQMLVADPHRRTGEALPHRSAGLRGDRHCATPVPYAVPSTSSTRGRFDRR